MTARSTRQTTFFIAAALLALAGLAAPLRAATVGQVWYTIGQGGSPNTGLFRVGVDGSNPVLQQSGSSPTAVIFPYGVAVDPVQGKFFYAENYDYFTSEQIRSGSMATTNSSLTTIYNTPNPNAEVLGGLRVDTTSHNLYFALADYAAATNNGVYRLAETGGSATKVGGTGGVALQSPLNLALDLPDNLVFLTDVYNGTVNNLDVCNLSTGNAVSLYSLPTLSSLLFGVDVDPVNHFLYLAVSPQATGAGNEILKFSFTVTGSGTTAAVGSLTGPTTLYNSTSAGEPFDVVADLLVGTLYLADNNLPGVTHGTVLGTGSVSALHTVAGEVSAQNVFLEAAPVLTTSGSTVSYSGGGAAVVVDASASVTDSTSTELSWVAVTMTSGYNTGDILSANPAGTVITDSYNSSTGALTLAGPDTLAHFKQVLDTVSYSSTNINANNSGFNPTRTLGFAASDGFITVGGSASDSVTIPDTPPTLTAGGTAQYNAAGGPVVADSSLVVTDPDNTTLASATVSISSGFLSGDKLLFTNQNGITGSYNTITGRLGLSGTSSVANYQTALQSISYTSSASDPSKGGTDNTRILSWTANDGTLDSTAVTSTVDITVFTPTPTATASLTPSATASTTPTDSPSFTPSDTPTQTPTATPIGTSTLTATLTPSATASLTPTDTPSGTPTASATETPSGTPSFTPTATPSFTSSSSMTATPSLTVTNTPSLTPTATVTASPTLTASSTPSGTPTLTATATITATPTVTDTPIPSPTPTVTPVYNASSTGGLFLGPNVLTNGQSAQLYFRALPQSSSWNIYAIDGERVDHFTVTGATGHSWNPAKLASGLYLVRVHVVYQDGTSGDGTFKAVVLH